ncbi:MAG: hypothetical protein ACYCT0_13210 [Sulfobacillus sp.]
MEQDYQYPESLTEAQSGITPAIPTSLAPKQTTTTFIVGFVAASALMLSTFGLAWVLWSLWPLVLFVGRTPR